MAARSHCVTLAASTRNLCCLCCCCVPLCSPAAAPSCCAPQHEPEAAAPLEVDPQPFSYRPLPASIHFYEMVDGVVRVWPDAQSRRVCGRGGGEEEAVFRRPSFGGGGRGRGVCVEH